MSGVTVTTTVNGDPVQYVCPADESLLDVLRNRLNMTGSKEGCGTGDCGACSITMDGRLVCSCLVLGAEAKVEPSKPLRAYPKGANCTRFKRSSLNTRRFSAVSVRLGS